MDQSYSNRRSCFFEPCTPSFLKWLSYYPARNLSLKVNYFGVKLSSSWILLTLQLRGRLGVLDVFYFKSHTYNYLVNDPWVLILPKLGTWTIILGRSEYHVTGWPHPTIIYLFILESNVWKFTKLCRWFNLCTHGLTFEGLNWDNQMYNGCPQSEINVIGENDIFTKTYLWQTKWRSYKLGPPYKSSRSTQSFEATLWDKLRFQPRSSRRQHHMHVTQDPSRLNPL